jgi:hypothetical protein
MKLFQLFIPFFFFFSNPLYAGLPLTSGFDEQETWLTRESEHFRFIFPAHLKGFALTMEEDAEDVFGELSTWTGYTVNYMIDIIITDNRDYANASVRLGSRGFYLTVNTVHPYQGFIDGIDAYRSWYRNLLTHELTHVFFQDMVGGFPAFTHKIFGKLLYPNASTPLFYTEGFPAYAETVKDSGYGRGNYTYTSMTVRAAILEDNPPLIDRASNSTLLWPGGQARYLYGVSFVEWLVRSYGEQKLLDFNKANSSKLSYASSFAFQKVYGKTLYQVWNEWLDAETRRAYAFQKKIESEGITALIPLSTKRGYVYALDMSSSEKMAVYSLRPVDRLGGLYVYDFQTEKERLLMKGLYAENIRISKDDKKIWYIRSDLRKNIFLENNIYEFDLDKKKETKITKEGHIQDFIFTDDEKELLACYSTPYGTEIRFLTSEGVTRRIIRQDILPVVEQPALSHDRSKVAFSCRNAEGERAIYITLLDELKNGIFSPRRITPLKQAAYSPKWLSSTELVFIGDENGAYNLFRVNTENGDLHRTTNVTAGIFDPAVSASGTILLREYTSRGFRIVKTSLQALRYSYSDSHIQTEKISPEDNDKEPVQISDKRRYEDTQINGYNPANWLFPGYWSPVYLDERISLGLGFYTSASDLLQRHAYNTGILYDVMDTRVKAFVHYTYYSYPFNYFVSFFASQKTDAAYFAPSVAFFPGISFPVVKRDFLIKADLGVIFESPYSGIDLSFNYNSTRLPIKWIGPEQGIAFEQGVYYNIGQEQFLMLSDYFSWYQRILDVFLFNIRFQSRWNPVDETERVIFGAYGGSIYLPLNGVYTMGYPSPVPARFAIDAKTSITTRLIAVDRGIRSLPFFFEGINLSAYLDNGLAVSPGSEYDFVAENAGELFDDPWGHIRSSVGAELGFSFLIGYEFPLEFNLGYVYALSSGGQSGFYFDATLGLPF